MSVHDLCCIGYITQEIKVNKNDKLIITLEEDTETLDEVVVVGYGAIQKRSVSTAISTVKGGKISEMPTSNISQSLVGMSSGITLQQISVESREPLRQSGSEEQAPSIAEMTPYL